MISITYNSISIIHNSKMVGSITEKSVWFLFLVFSSFCFQSLNSLIFEWWVMKIENTDFSFQNSVSNSIFVIKHTRSDPLSEQHTWGVAFDGLKRCFLLHFSFFFLSFLWSSLPSILFSFFWWSQAPFFFLLNHRTHLVFTAILSFFLSFFLFFFLFFITEPIWSSPLVVTVEFVAGPIVATLVRHLCKSNHRCINFGFVQVQSSLHQF